MATLDATFLPAEDTIADPLGVKGLGELVIVGVPAAIANAVFNASGRRITDLPITLEKCSARLDRGCDHPIRRRLV